MRSRTLLRRVTSCRGLWLAASAALLGGCGLLGGGAESSSAASVSTVSGEAPSPELQARYASLVADLISTEATTATTAATALEAFSHEHPELSGPLVNLGLVQVRAGNPVGALQWFDQAARVCSRCGPVWNEIGVLQVHQGRFVEAEEAYRRAIDAEPGYANAYYNLAILYELYVPRPDLALQNYEVYLQLGGDGKDVEKWLVDLRRRVDDMPKTARVDGSS